MSTIAVSKWIKRITLLLQLPPCCCSWAMLTSQFQTAEWACILERTTLTSSHSWSLLITSAGMVKDSVPVIPHALQGFFSHVILQLTVAILTLNTAYQHMTAFQHSRYFQARTYTEVGHSHRLFSLSDLTVNFAHFQGFDC